MGRMTLHDIMQATDPKGAIAKLVEVLNRQNAVMRVLPFIETNKANSYVFQSRAALPSVHFRRFNQGYKVSKSRATTVEEACGQVVGRSEIDRDLAELNGNAAAARFNEDKAFMESFAQKFSQTFFYQSTKVDPDTVMGMSPRLDSLSGIGKEQIESFGTPGNNTNTSMWGMVLGENGVHGIYPKGSAAGLSHRDRGILDVEDENGDNYPAYVTEWSWKYGFVCKNMQKIVRIPNIDVTNLTGASPASLLEAMIRASYRMNLEGDGRLVWFANRTTLQALDIEARREVKAGGQLSYEVVDGKPVLHFRKAPILLDDNILNTEAAVV